MSRSDDLGLHWRVSRLPAAPDHVPDEEAERILGPDVERWQELRRRNPALASRWFAGRRAVSAIAAETLPTPWRGFAPSVPGRKPTFADIGADFSISHSGELLLVAVVEHGRVGADIEVNAVAFDNERTLSRIFTDAELATVAGMEGAERTRWLMRLWTAKEAVAKLDGSGLALDPRRLELGSLLPHPSLAPSSTIAATIAIAADPDTGAFELRHPEVTDHLRTPHALGAGSVR